MKIELNSNDPKDMPLILALFDLIGDAKKAAEAQAQAAKPTKPAPVEEKKEEPKPKAKTKPKTVKKPKTKAKVKPEPVEEPEEVKQPTAAEFNEVVQAHKAKFDVNRTKEILVEATGENHPASVKAEDYKKAMDALKADKGAKAEEIEDLIEEEF